MSTRKAAAAPPGPERGAWRPGHIARYTGRAMKLVWQTNPALAIVFGVLTVIAGALPALTAWVGQLIIDGVVAALELPAGGRDEALAEVFRLVALEAAIVAVLAAAQRGISTCQALLRAQLGNRVNTMILEKALGLSLAHFEDDEFYDKLTRARRDASTRPLSLVNRSFGLAQNAISLTLRDGSIHEAEADEVDELGLVDDVEAGDRGAPGVGPQERGDDAHRRRLARSVGAEQAQDRALGHGQVDAVEGAHLAAA